MDPSDITLLHKECGALWESRKMLSRAICAKRHILKSITAHRLSSRCDLRDIYAHVQCLSFCATDERDFSGVPTVAIYTPSHSKWGIPAVNSVCTELEHLTGSHGSPVTGHSGKGQFRSMLDVNAWIPPSIICLSYHICSLRGALSP